MSLLLRQARVRARTRKNRSLTDVKHMLPPPPRRICVRVPQKAARTGKLRFFRALLCAGHVIKLPKSKARGSVVNVRRYVQISGV